MKIKELIVKALEHKGEQIKCSLQDHFAFRFPVPVAFFYHTHISSDLIIKSLQHVLKDYPIFAGTLRQVKDHLYIDCNNQGVYLKIVHSDTSLIQQLSDLQEMDGMAFVDMINPYKALKKGTPLLTIKLSYFADGMSIGFCWHHSVGDMVTFMEFLKAFSGFAAGVGHKSPPLIHDRNQYLNQITQTSNKTIAADLKKLGFFDIISFVKQSFSPKQGIYFYFFHEEIEALRLAISDKVGHKLSRNSVLCAHMLNCLANCRKDPSSQHYASIIVNYRSRIGLSSHAMGNFIDALTLKFAKFTSTETLAANIHEAVQKYGELHFHFPEVEKFVQKNGGVKNIGRLIPKTMLPQFKNLLITNWSNFSVYSIDFGVQRPFLFLPVGKAPIPWVSCITEGFENKGLLLSLVLPTKIAKRLTHPEMLKTIHKFRTPTTHANFLSQRAF